MLFTHNNLLIVEQNAIREDCYFDEEKDNFWDFSMRSGLLPCANHKPIEIAKKHSISLLHFVENDEENLLLMLKEEVNKCRQKLQAKLYVTQPRVVLIVGQMTARNIFGRSQVNYEEIKSICWDNSRRKTSFYCIPSTRKTNKRISKEALMEYV
ncbi:hypothetical protein RMCBS344292_18068 [Rhizopus microsporus]|nr:hypothetical protein RMCBS344292_18068 [Rhizopus microsporus]